MIQAREIANAQLLALENAEPLLHEGIIQEQ
jgi:hypothetical protein